MNPEPYLGLYINLDRSVGRRREFEDQLVKHGIAGRYQRFPAIDGTVVGSAREKLKPGEVGCFHSHYKALLHAKTAGIPAHIVEDDVILSDHLVNFARDAVSSRLLDGFDMLFTDTYVHANPFTLRFLKEGMDAAFDEQGRLRPDFTIRFFPLAMQELTCTSSYFVGANSIDRVLAVLKAELDAGPRMPLDYCYRAAADRGTLNIACTMPFLTTVRLDSMDSSTIANSSDRGFGLDIALQTLLRYSFFVDRDLAGHAARHLEQLIGPSVEHDRHHRLIVDVLSAILSSSRSVRARPPLL
jgi:GR25 family glycosyltransferase involved in LPS biosynthesis